MPPTRNALLQELTREEARLSELEQARTTTQKKIESLRSELASIAAMQPSAAQRPPMDSQSPRSTADKVRLFRSLFRGRPNIFPLRFVSKKTGKPGYAPACSNKWEPGLCMLKTGGKCSECTNQAFVPVSDQIVIAHLQGRHVMGVYPLLEDETCWFLAVDFDKGTWREDVAAFTETCRSMDVPVAIERSRSGNGAHAWFFFAAPVSANVARRMGCYLLTDTMNLRAELSMSSYDRLFPNQDTMPRGGFGNLIALPLQYEALMQGNSVFVNDQFEPFIDQWAYLASLSRIEPNAAELIAKEASRTGQVVGVRFANAAPDDEEAQAPWVRLPSSRMAVKFPAGSLPKEVKAIVAQRLYIE